MATVQAHDIKVLNDLIAAMLDSAQSYEAAAEIAGDESLRRCFEQRSIERRRLRMMLQDTVRLLGAEPADAGTMGGAARRAFSTLRSDLTGDTAGIMAHLDEVEDGVQAAFDYALDDSDLVPATRETLNQAYAAIQAGIGVPREQAEAAGLPR